MQVYFALVLALYYGYYFQYVLVIVVDIYINHDTCMPEIGHWILKAHV